MLSKIYINSYLINIFYCIYNTGLFTTKWYFLIDCYLQAQFCIYINKTEFKSFTPHKGFLNKLQIGYTTAYDLLTYCTNLQLKLLKAYVFMKPAKKSLVYLGGKVVFEFWPLRQCWAVGPIQI